MVIMEVMMKQWLAMFVFATYGCILFRQMFAAVAPKGSIALVHQDWPGVLAAGEVGEATRCSELGGRAWRTREVSGERHILFY